MKLQAEPILPAWTVLPSLPLIGVGTSLVESVEHYVSRLAWTVGVTIKSLCRLPPPFGEPGFSEVRGINKYCGPGSIYKRRIEHLETLTGNPTIRCGSLYVLDELLSPIGSCGHLSRRWCPICIEAWDESDSCEPLIWKMNLLEACSVHGCRLESHCRRCGARQSYGRPYDVRRTCARCGAGLGGKGVAISLSNSQAWAQRQLHELVSYCATPDKAMVPMQSFRVFTEGLLAVPIDRSPIPGVIRALFKRSRAKKTTGRVTLRTLLNLCALQGVYVMDALLDPVGASSEPLIDLWSSYRPLDLPMGSHETKILMYNASVAGVLRICRRVYLPSMRLFMRELNLNRDVARELSPDLYETYEAAHWTQASEAKLVHAERCFWHCAVLLKEHRKIGGPESPIRAIAARVSDKQSVTPHQSRMIALSALYAIRAVERARLRYGATCQDASVCQ